MILRRIGQQEGWDACIRVWGSDLGSSGARKQSVFVMGVFWELLPCSAALPAGKGNRSDQRDKIVKISREKSLSCPQPVFAVVRR